MARVFISHVEEDAPVAVALAAALESAGYTTWYYERDSVPGPSYLQQILEALDTSMAVILVISPQTLRSWQVDREVVQAHETGKPFVPLLRGVSHAEFRHSRPEWAMILGATTSLPLPDQGVEPLMPRLLDGLRWLERGSGPLALQRRPGPAWLAPLLRLGRHRAALPIAAALLVAVVGAALLALRHAPTPADPASPACCGARFFPQTHHNLAGPFLAFYRRYGGLDTFGYPRTEVFRDGGSEEQYTDRFLFVLKGGVVTTAPLGRLLTAGRSFPGVAPFPSSPTALYFPSTGHSLHGLFMHYWQTHHGALLLGAPISEEDMESNQDGTARFYQTQWFANGRLEYHPENMEARYQVELGLTGREALRQRGWLP